MVWEKDLTRKNGHGPNLGGAGETIPALSDGDVEHQLLHLDLPHRVSLLLLGSLSNKHHRHAQASNGVS